MGKSKTMGKLDLQAAAKHARSKRKPRETKLTERQKRFAEEYIIDLNGTKAAERAGFSIKTANEQAVRLLANVSVRKQIEELQAARSKRTEITADRVLQELARIAFFDFRKLYRQDGSLKAVHELDDEAAAVLAGADVVEMAGGAKIGGAEGVEHTPMYTKKTKIPDKVAALGLAMRHLGMLNDKVKVGNDPENPMPAAGVLIVPGMIADPKAWESQVQGGG
jgi:phage terminase small subunit